MGWWALLLIPGFVVLSAIGIAFDRWLGPEPPAYAPHGEPGRTIPFCACSRGSQRLGMRF